MGKDRPDRGAEESRLTPKLWAKDPTLAHRFSFKPDTVHTRLPLDQKARLHYPLRPYAGVV